MGTRISTIIAATAALCLASTTQGDEPQPGRISAPVQGEGALAGEGVFSVRTYGAVGDGAHLDTAAIQAAIDACAAARGGIVFVPPGRYLSGTIFLKSNVTLHLAAAATILGSTNLAHYATGIQPCGFVNHPHLDKCLVYADKAENVAITGPGTIDGQGRAFPLVGPDGKAGQRPMLLRLVSSRTS